MTRQLIPTLRAVFQKSLVTWRSYVRIKGYRPQPKLHFPRIFQCQARYLTGQYGTSTLAFRGQALECSNRCARLPLLSNMGNSTVLVVVAHQLRAWCKNVDMAWSHMAFGSKKFGCAWFDLSRAACEYWHNVRGIFTWFYCTDIPLLK